jgi:hypothetical protein
MLRRLIVRIAAVVVAVGTLVAQAPSSAQGDRQTALERYTLARQAFDQQTSAYWRSVAERQRQRSAKRRNNETIELSDYVLTQPPVYAGPPRPVDPSTPETQPSRPEIPLVADFVKAAAEQFGFAPDRPESELAFKRAYARAALAAGLTRDQIVRIYAFETGGTGTYDMQAGVTPSRPRAISPALGYNQLLSTNSVGLLAEHGDDYVKELERKAERLTGETRNASERKIDALRRMIAFSRTVPNRWSEHDRLAKETPGGFGIHAAVLDRDLGPMLQVQKLLNSVRFARSKGYRTTLTATELELMNFTGDGNGFDMVMMPQALRRQVPTANFFQQQGYERNPIARRTGVVAALIAAIDAKMDQASQAPGARELAAAFADATAASDPPPEVRP